MILGDALGAGFYLSPVLQRNRTVSTYAWVHSRRTAKIGTQPWIAPGGQALGASTGSRLLSGQATAAALLRFPTFHSIGRVSGPSGRAGTP
jgi:hypothetical protein